MPEERRLTLFSNSFNDRERQKLDEKVIHNTIRSEKKDINKVEV